MNGAKESENKIVSNQQIMDAIMSLKRDLDVIKTMVGFNDKPIGMPEKRNHNTDPGPWQKTLKKT